MREGIGHGETVVMWLTAVSAPRMVDTIALVHLITCLP